MNPFKTASNSFFRTLGRFLFYLLLGLIISLFFKEQPKALEQNYDWVINSKNIARGGFSQASNGSNYNVIWRQAGDYIVEYTGSTPTISSYLQTRTFLEMADTDYLGPSGMTAYIQPLSIMRKDYLYSTTLYVCSTKSLVNANFKAYPQFNIDSAGIPGTPDEVTDLNRTIYYSLSQFGIGQPIAISDYCYAYVNYMVPRQDANIFGIHFTKTGGSIAGVKLTLVGFEFTSMGYYSEAMKKDIQDALGSATQGLATKQDVQRVQQEVEGINDTLNDDDISGADSEATSFFDNFSSNDHGLTGIITAPLNLINNLASATCSPLVLPLPYVNKNLTLPCMSDIYRQYFGSFFTIYQTITFGIIAYYVCVKIFYKVQDFKNPSNSEIEVLEL